MAKNLYNRASFPSSDIVCKNVSGGALAAGDIVRVSTAGDGVVAGVIKALATTSAQVDGVLGILVSGLDGSATPANNAYVSVRLTGLVMTKAYAPDAMPVVGDPVYVSDLGTARLAAGTVARRVGKVVAVDGVGLTYDTLFTGTFGGTVDKTYVDTGDGLRLLKTANLSDLVNAGTARTNLGLGSAAVAATGDFDAAGLAAAAVVTAGLYTDTKAWLWVRAASLAPLAACAYSGAGVGTLTGSAFGALDTFDGITLIAGNVCLVASQANPIHNGLYTVTVIGDGGTAFVLTRLVGWQTGNHAALRVVLTYEGTIAGTRMVHGSVSADTIGTSNLAFAAFGPVWALNSAMDLKLPKAPGVASPLTKALYQATAVLTDQATIAIDCDLADTFTLTIGGARTLGAPTNPAEGKKFDLVVTQDGTGSRTLDVSNAAFTFPGGIEPVLTATATIGVDVFSFLFSGGVWRVTFASAFA